MGLRSRTNNIIVSVCVDTIFLSFNNFSSSATKISSQGICTSSLPCSNGEQWCLSVDTLHLIVSPRLRKTSSLEISAGTCPIQLLSQQVLHVRAHPRFFGLELQVPIGAWSEQYGTRYSPAAIEKAPIYLLLVSHRPPEWIFCNRIYHH